MSLITHVESFRLANNNADLVRRGWYAAEGTIVNDADFPSGRCYQLATSNQYVLSYSKPLNLYTALSFYFKTGAVGSAVIANIDSGANKTDYPNAYRNTNIEYTADGGITLRGDSGDPIWVSPQTGIIQANTVHHIEWRTYVTGSGWAEVWVDGVKVLDVPSGDLWENSSDSITFHGDAAVHSFSDIIIRHATTDAEIPHLGVHRIHVQQASADTAQADFTPLAGAGWDNINDPLDAPNDGDISYVSSSTQGHASEWELEDLPETPSTIHFVQVTTECKKMDAATRGVTAYIKGTASADGLEVGAPDSNYGIARDTFYVSPDTAVAFTAAEINALKIGFKIST